MGKAGIHIMCVGLFLLLAYSADLEVLYCRLQLQKHILRLIPILKIVLNLLLVLFFLLRTYTILYRFRITGTQYKITRKFS